MPGFENWIVFTKKTPDGGAFQEGPRHILRNLGSRAAKAAEATPARKKVDFYLQAAYEPEEVPVQRS